MKPMIRYLLKLAGLIVFLYLLFTCVLSLHRMTGNTMYPSVRDGDLCIFYRLESYNMNDVVLYRDSDGKKRVGRIVALAGQQVDFPEEGGYLVNGCEVSEEITYPTYGEKGQAYPITVEQDSFFLLNDFRSDSSDSRTEGVISEEQLEGKLIFILRRRGF
jgi:signal peptidase I